MIHARNIKGASLAVAVSAMVMVSAVEAGAVPLFDPEKADWGCKLSMKKVEQRIRIGSLRRHWIVFKKGPGKLKGTLNVRGRHKLVVTIKFTKSSFDIDYKDSENLNYRKYGNKEYIHKNGNKWMQNLNHVIALHLSEKCV